MEEARVNDWRDKLKLDIEKKEAEYREWFERKLPDIPVPTIQALNIVNESHTNEVDEPVPLPAP